jgi:hypothetical protein
MKKSIFLKAILCIASLFIGKLAFSQATRTWVSGVGDDVNPCSRTAPCKTFAGAISKTAAGGEINAIDAGGMGAVTITKSITIDGRGTNASILSSMTNGVIINAGNDGVIILRNLSVNGAGNGISGVKIIAAKKVIIEHCTLGGFTKKGIEVITKAPCTIILNDVTIHHAEDALSVTDSLGAVIIDDCRFQSLSNAGINLLSGQVTIIRSNISDCNTAVIAASNSSVSLSNNTISNNATVFQAKGTIASAGNNLLTGNGSLGTAPTLIKLQ